VWKPLKGPLHDWPLAFCDASVVVPDLDLESADLLYPDLATENFQVYYRNHYKWYYLGGQGVNEAIVFTQASNFSGSLPGNIYLLMKLTPCTIG
jgi:hypothetical protein